MRLIIICINNRYECLGVKEILAFIKENHRSVYAYYPEPKIELPKTPKQWISNVAASVLGETFNKWVR